MLSIWWSGIKYGVMDKIGFLWNQMLSLTFWMTYRHIWNYLESQSGATSQGPGRTVSFWIIISLALGVSSSSLVPRFSWSCWSCRKMSTLGLRPCLNCQRQYHTLQATGSITSNIFLHCLALQNPKRMSSHTRSISFTVGLMSSWISFSGWLHVAG